MERYVFGQKYDRQMSLSVFMKYESQEWTDFTYPDGSTNLQSVMGEAPKNINISYDTEKNEVLLSSLEANENFWGLYRFLIERHFRYLGYHMPKFIRQRKVLRQKCFKAGDQAVIDNWFVEIHLQFHADCTVERRSKEAPFFDYVFKFSKE